MKTLVINTRIVAIALVTLFAVAFSLPASANGTTTPAPVELKYIGKYNNQPVFQLTMNGTTENEFTVVIRDEYNTILYKEVLKGENINKKFMLNTDELGDTAVKFEITSKTSDKAVVYEVNRNSRIVEDMVVNKIK